MRKSMLMGLLSLGIVLVSSVACSPKIQSPPPPDTIWFSNPNSYRTNVLDIAQKETPFTIVLPTYVPNDIIPFPYIEGLAKSDFRDDLPVRIMYYTARYASNPIYIEESQGAKGTLPAGDYSYLAISGIEVLEDKTQSPWVTDPKTISFVQCLDYSWNKDDVHYYVSVYEYQPNEARKIVESMINQD
jgi:hypothetical protein